MAKALRKDTWRSDPATDAQRRRLAEEGIHCPPNATKGEASDLISATVSADADELAMLRFFGVSLPRGATQLDFRRASDAIFADPANVEKWKHRPASKEQRKTIKLVEGKVPAGITHCDAEKRINDYEDNPELAAKAEAAQDAYDAAEWREDNIRDIHDALNDSDGMYGIKRISLTLVRRAIVEWEAEACSTLEQLERIDHFEERLAERIRAIDPSKGTKEFKEMPDYFRPWVVSPSYGRSTSYRAPTTPSVSSAMNRAASQQGGGDQALGMIIVVGVIIAIVAWWKW